VLYRVFPFLANSQKPDLRLCPIDEGPVVEQKRKDKDFFIEKSKEIAANILKSNR